MPKFEVVRMALLHEGGMAGVLRGFERRHGRLPTAIVVNHAGVESLKGMVEKLGYDIPVEGSGGALMGEVWLQVNDRREEATDA